MGSSGEYRLPKGISCSIFTRYFAYCPTSPEIVDCYIKCYLLDEISSAKLRRLILLFCKTVKLDNEYSYLEINIMR